MKKVDFFIVGQGIAGTVLSHQLTQKGFSVKVFDTYKENSASRIAAGVYNPVAYRKLKMAQFAEFLIPEMNLYYPKLEKELGISFFKPMSFLKLLTDFEEFNNWHIQCAIKTNIPFMSPNICTDDFNKGLKNPYGAGQVLQSGVTNLAKLIDAWRTKLIEKDFFSDEKFSHANLKTNHEGYTYNEYLATKIIFCEGIGISNNPWFDWLPIQKFKGEVLEIHAPELNLNRMVNRGVFLLPIGNNIFKVGATHDWRNVNETPTEDGKNELLEKLDKFINVPYTITKHSAGLRPASRDRHPYIGEHPENKNMFVFNGLGSKGVIMAPWLAKEFIKEIKTKNWPKEFNIKRYTRFYNEREIKDEKN